MKKFRYFLVAVLLLLSGACFLSAEPFVATSAAEEETPAENITYIDSLNEFKGLFTSTAEKVDVNIVLRTDLDFGGTAWSTDKTFSGIFDGNGYSIKNVTFASSNNKFGLFPTAKNATIKNVKLDGEVVFDLSATNGDVRLGAFVGSGENVHFETCEIASSATFKSKLNGIENQSLQFASNAYVGGFAGELDSFSSLSNCVMKAPISVSSTLTVGGNVRAGGFVGRASSCDFNYCLNYGNLNYIASSDKVEFFLGGLAGEVLGANSAIVNCVYDGKISKAAGMNLAKARIGAICATAGEDARASHVYYSDDSLSPFGYSGTGVTQTKVEKVLKSTLTTDYFKDETNWAKIAEYWDFNKTWMEGAPLRLQRFETFTFGFASRLDTGSIIDKDSTTFVGGKAVTIEEGNSSQENKIVRQYRYGEEVGITINFHNDYHGFYTLGGIIRNGTEPLTEGDYTKPKPITLNGRVTGYTTKLNASAMTAGTYSFQIDAIRFNCWIVTENAAKGGINQGGTSYRSEISLPMTYGVSTKIYSKGEESPIYYTPNGWDLYYGEFENGEIPEAKTSPDFSGDALEIVFGKEPFNKEFTLVARFTNEKALNVSFNLNDNISLLEFGDREYTGETRKVSPDSPAMKVKLVLKKDYELDLQRFSSLMAAYNQTVNPILTENEDGSREYNFTINMRKVKETIGESNDVTFNLPIITAKGNNGGNLLWLWILIPVIVVLIAGGVTAFILVRHYRYKHGAGKFGAANSKNAPKLGKKSAEKPKKDDFKDFYY